MVVFVEALVKSLVFIKKNWKVLPIIGALDLLFFFLLGILSSTFKNASGPYLSSIVSQSSKLTAEVSLAIAQRQSGLAVLFSDAVFVSNIKSFLFVALLSVIALYVIWILAEGRAWSYLAKNTKNYFVNFSKTSLFWFVLVLLYFVFLTCFSLITQIRLIPLISSALIQLFGVIFLVVIFYFAFISISLVPMNLKQNLRKTFALGVKSFHNFIAAYAIVILVLLVNFQLTYFLFKSFISGTSIVSYFFMILRILIALPFLAWARVYLIEVAKNN